MDRTVTLQGFQHRLEELRAVLEAAFRPETAGPADPGALSTPSAGQCVPVALIAHHLLGGSLLSTFLRGRSHWFNRVAPGGLQAQDIDLTGDQFGRPRVQAAPVGTLYAPWRVRRYAELGIGALARARFLAESAGLLEVAHEIEVQLGRRVPVEPRWPPPR